MADQPFHCAQGPLPPSEHGLSGRARVQRLPNGKLVGVFRLETSHGPFILSAELSSVQARSAVKEIAPVLAGGAARPRQPPHSHAHGHARRAAHPAPEGVDHNRYEVYANDMARLRANAVFLNPETLPAPQRLIASGTALAGGPHGHHGHGGHHGGGFRGGFRGGFYGPAYSYDLPLIVQEQAPVVTETPYIVATAKDPLTLRASPAGNAIGSMTSGSTFFVRTTQGGWAQGRSASGQIGWASMQFLRPAPSLAGTRLAGTHLSGTRLSGTQLAGAAERITQPWGDAERVYAKLMERDPRAWALLRDLVARTQQGDQAATKFWGAICAAHSRAHAGDFTRATAAEKSAADRMYLRFIRGEPAALAEVQKIVELARQGDPGAHRAWKLICLRHDDAKASAVMGASITFHPDRVRDLLRLISQARYAPAPYGARQAAPPYYPEGEPLPMGAPPGGEGGGGGGGGLKNLAAIMSRPTSLAAQSAKSVRVTDRPTSVTSSTMRQVRLAGGRPGARRPGGWNGGGLAGCEG